MEIIVVESLGFEKSSLDQFATEESDEEVRSSACENQKYIS